jgi:beta-phosphoglucomutase
MHIDDDEWLELGAGRAMSGAVAAVLARRGARHDATAAELLALRADRVFAESLRGGMTLRRGATSLLARVEGKTRLAVVTRLTRAQVEQVLALAGLEHAFESIVAAEDVLEPKPSREGYELLLDRLTRRRPLRRDRTIALEDGGPGIRAARGAGVRSLAVGAVPVDQAMEADGYLPTLDGVSLDDLARLAATRGERVE